MMSPRNHPRKLLLIAGALCALASLLIAGCVGLSFTYNHAERLLLWRIDRYFHLSRDQERLVYSQLANLHAWHRKTELPRYAEFIGQVHARWQDGLTEDEVDWILTSIQQLREALADRVAGESTLFLGTVDAKQILYLERVMQRDNRDLQSDVRATLDERSSRHAKRILSMLRDWLGTLTPEQENQVAQLIRTLPDTTEPWLTYRLQRQQEFVRLLRSNPTPAVLQHTLREWLATPEKNSPSAYAVSVQHFHQDIKRTILEIDRTITPRQRLHVSAKLQQLMHDIQALAAG